MTKVCVTALIGNTYHARVHMSTSGKDASSSEVDIDARPSDAINLAVRFNAPVYVNKQVLISLEQPVNWCIGSDYQVNEPSQQRVACRHMRDEVSLEMRCIVWFSQQTMG